MAEQPSGGGRSGPPRKRRVGRKMASVRLTASLASESQGRRQGGSGPPRKRWLRVKIASERLTVPSALQLPRVNREPDDADTNLQTETSSMNQPGVPTDSSQMMRKRIIRPAPAKAVRATRTGVIGPRPPWVQPGTEPPSGRNTVPL